MRRSFAFRVRLLLLVILALVTGAILLYRVSPEEEGFYPRCFVNKYTGAHCAGCGTTRCLHALLHGDIRQALAWNPLTVLLLPVMLWMGYRKASDYLRDDPPPRSPPHPYFVWGLGALFIVFTLARNISSEPFSWLAPHKLPQPTVEE